MALSERTNLNGSCSSGSSMSRRSRRHARVVEKPSSWIFVNSIPWRNMESMVVRRGEAREKKMGTHTDHKLRDIT